MSNSLRQRIIPPTVMLTVFLVMQSFAQAQLKGNLKEKLESGIHPNQIEGAIWQYKITREKQGEKQEMKGTFRVDNKAIFKLKKRVGDVIVEKDETQLVFTDSQELKGRAFVKKERGDIWKGSYLDEHRERWKFEMRKGED